MLLKNRASTSHPHSRLFGLGLRSLPSQKPFPQFCNAPGYPIESPDTNSKFIAQFILDCGLRPDEVFRMRVENLDFIPRTIFNPLGKTRSARRKVTMTDEVLEILRCRAANAKSAFVFPCEMESGSAI